MKRRSLIQAGVALSLAPGFLSGCARSSTPLQQTGYYKKGMYLSDNFAPVEVETTTQQLEVIGELPAELTGRYLRNGSNPLGKIDSDSYHWFSGNGMVHGVRLEDGKADWYRNRYVGGKSVSGPNTNVIEHAGRTWAIVESGTPPMELDYDLEPKGESPDWGGYTAHPKYDPETGELHAICYDWANFRDHVKYIVMDTEAKVAKNIDIPMPGMTMIHDMSLTENYVVIFDLPVTISFTALAMGADFPFRWDTGHEPRVGLMPRNGEAKDIVWSPVSANYSYHPMNAFEDEAGNVVIDICRYERMFDADINGPFGDSLPRLDRWTINPSARKITEEIIDERPQEFPRCHPDLNSKPYRYGYTLAVGNQKFPGIYKHDMHSGNATMFDFGAGRHGAEPLFVPKENAASEDDGFVMTFVFDESRQASELIILDALDMGRAPVAQVLLPVRVPYGFHGNWIPDENMS